MNLSPNFTLEEAVFSSTAVRRGVNNTPPPVIVENMQVQALGMELVRCVLGNLPIHVDSWYRSLALNLVIGGATNSGHMKGFATDFVCPAFGTPLEIARALLAAKIKFDKIIMEGTWLHISFDPLMRGIVLTAHFVPGQPTTYTDGL